MTRTEELEEIIGKRMPNGALPASDYYHDLFLWEKKAREHESARAERWKGFALNDLRPSKEWIEVIDKGQE